MNYLFNEIQRRKLTEFLCECWHDPYWHDMRGTVCIKCDEPVSLSHDRTFDTWDDLGALKEKLVEKGGWNEFLERGTRALPANMIFCDNKPAQLYSADAILWLMNPSRFCQLVLEAIELGMIK